IDRPPPHAGDGDHPLPPPVPLAPPRRNRVPDCPGHHAAHRHRDPRPRVVPPPGEDSAAILDRQETPGKPGRKTDARPVTPTAGCRVMNSGTGTAVAPPARPTSRPPP